MSRFKNSTCLEVPSHLEESSLSNGSLDVSTTPDWRRSSSPTGYLYPHRRSDMCLVVKRRRRRVQQGILQVFSSDSWTATGVGLAAFAGALWLIGRRNVLIEVLDAFIHGLFVTRERDRRGNCLFVLLSAFGLVMVSAFTGRFMGFLAVLEEPSQVQTLEEVAHQVTKVYGDVALPSIFKDVQKDDVVWKLLAKFEPYSEEKTMEMVVLEFVEDWPGPAVVVSLDQVRPLLDGPDLWDTKTGASLAYPVPQCLLSPAYVSYPTRPRWPQQRLFDARLGIVAQAGIVNKLDRYTAQERPQLSFLSLLNAASQDTAAVGFAQKNSERPFQALPFTYYAVRRRGRVNLEKLTFLQNGTVDKHFQYLLSLLPFDSPPRLPHRCFNKGMLAKGRCGLVIRVLTHTFLLSVLPSHPLHGTNSVMLVALQNGLNPEFKGKLTF